MNATTSHFPGLGQRGNACHDHTTHESRFATANETCGSECVLRNTDLPSGIKCGPTQMKNAVTVQKVSRGKQNIRRENKLRMEKPQGRLRKSETRRRAFGETMVFEDLDFRANQTILWSFMPSQRSPTGS